MIDTSIPLLKEITVKENDAQVVFEKFIEEKRPIEHTTQISLGNNSKLTYFVALFNATQVNKTIEVNLDGAGSEANILGVYFGKDHSTYNFRVVSNHRGSHTRALTWINGILTDHSQSNFDGLVKIVPDVAWVNSYLANHVLVLGEDAKANAIPSLEIESNEVKCSHEATIGQIDESHMFYLMSRGITRADAQKLIIRGFFESVMLKIENTEFRDTISSELATALGADGWGL